MATPGPAESFRDLLLRYRARSGLTQRELAERVGVHRRSVQEWEGGMTYPSPERLEAVVRVLLESHGLAAGHERAEAEALWAAVQRSAPHTHAPFDSEWFDRLLAGSVAPGAALVSTARDNAAVPIRSAAHQGATDRRQDWGEAPDTSGFVGRTEEVDTLSGWVRDERCRLVTVLGIGGIGKTSLAARVAQHLTSSFDRVYWRSLRDALPVSDWLAGAIGFLSDQQVVPPAGDSDRLMAVLQLLRARRCLLVLDNFETLFELVQLEGRQREGLAGYVRLLQVLGEASHQSCLLLTSREAPSELAGLGGAVRTLRLGGMGVDETQVLLASKQLAGSREQWAGLTARFGGNGLALKVVSETIRELFGGDIGLFLDEASASGLFGGMRRLLADQIERSSVPERRVLRMLAIEREPVTLTELLRALAPRLGRGEVVETLEALRRRSLVERAETPGAAAFTLQSVVLEYVTERLVEDVADEIERAEPVLLLDQPLIEAQAKDYVRQTQERLIGEPILERLQKQNGAEARLLHLLSRWRDQPLPTQGYGPGNVVNLLRVLRGHLRGLNMSDLALRQVYLAQIDAQEASLAGAQLTDVVLADVFGLPLSVALPHDSTLLAVGTSAGEVWLWRLADRAPLWSAQAHTGGVWGLAVSADGDLLASGGADGTVRLWESATGRPVATLKGHAGAVSGVALSADGRLLASGGADGTARLWDTSTGRPTSILQGHSGAVWSVSLSSNCPLLASGGEDGTVRLWQTQTGELLANLQGHTGAVSSVALSPDGQSVASGGADGTVRLWHTATSRCVANMQGHSGAVWSVAVSSGGWLLASGSEDGTLRLWEKLTGEPLATLQGHAGAIRGVALSGDSRLVASGSFDGTVRLWEAEAGRQLATFQGQTGAVWDVDLCADGRLLASGSEDGTVRLWDALAGRERTTLHGHTGAVRGVALSSDGQLLASGSSDMTVRLWDTETGRPLATLQGHIATVRGVAMSADGRLLASASYDGTVRLWDTGVKALLATLQGPAGGVSCAALSADGRLLASGNFDGSLWLWDTQAGSRLATLQGHTATVRGVALSADGRLLASGGEDGTVLLWDTRTATSLGQLQGHTATVRGVALSSDGRLLASGGEDGTVRLWDTQTRTSRGTLQGHTATVRGIALSADDGLLASGSFDGTMRLWNVNTATCLHVLRPELRYQGMDITGLAGITDAQHSALLAMGAVERGHVA